MITTSHKEWKQFKTAMDLSEWQTARDIVWELMNASVDADPREYTIVHRMVEYYRQNVCRLCNGSGRVAEGEFDDMQVRECACTF